LRLLAQLLLDVFLLAAWLLKTTSTKLQADGGDVEFVHSASKWLGNAALGSLPSSMVVMPVGTFGDVRA
jgi:uncharacterized membrane protein